MKKKWLRKGKKKEKKKVRTILHFKSEYKCALQFRNIFSLLRKKNKEVQEGKTVVVVVVRVRKKG